MAHEHGDNIIPIEGVEDVITAPAAHLLNSGFIVVSVFLLIVVLMGIVIYYQSQVIEKQQRRIWEVVDRLDSYNQKIAEVLTENTIQMRQLPADLLRLMQ